MRSSSKQSPSTERGNATLTAILIMALLAMFTAAALSRVTNESIVMGNDYSQTQAFYAAQASLELMSRNFGRIFEVRLNPTAADLNAIRDKKPSIAGFDFMQDIQQLGSSQPITIDEGPFAGLTSLRDLWRLDAVATYSNGAQVHLQRMFYNHRIPIFQFGIFYNDDMEFHPGPKFNFGGRVHSNGHIFMMASTGLYFRSRVTAVGEIVHDVARNGTPFTYWGDKVFVANASGSFKQVTQGSVTGGPDIKGVDPDMPDGSPNTNWDSFSKQFEGNLLPRQRPLRLPLQIGSGKDPIELIKRGLPSDDPILMSSRYFNKPGIRITLSDSQSKLPGGSGGVRLDGASNGLGGDQDPDGTRGYKPLPMTDGYQATRMNGHRLYTGPSYDGTNRQTWIKIEIVRLNEATLMPETIDITRDLLSLGFTEKASQLGLSNDDRAIIKLQRYVIPGPPVKVSKGDLSNTNTTATYTSIPDRRDPSGTLRTVYTYSSNSGGLSFVATSQKVGSNWTPNNAAAAPGELNFEVQVNVGGTQYRVVPFPIEMYDPREGLYNDSLTGSTWNSIYNPGSNDYKVPWCGVMSMIDIDMYNLGRFLRGDWDGKFPANASLPGGSLSSDDIPDNGGQGWIIYVSDRRGDADNDGEYDMEDVYGPNDGILQPGEDVNGDGVLQADYTWESAKYTEGVQTDLAAFFDHKYFRRGVRIINGETLYGTTTKGYSIASENAIYIMGNFNATGISAVGTPSQPSDYTGPQVPTSVVADAVVVLSRQWADGKSFRNPFSFGTRVVTDPGGETTVRTALLMGDTKSSLNASPNQGGGDPRLNGGVHNFKRFLENWSATRLNFAGTLINLFYSRNNNGPFKCCSHVYSPPTRNWVFDTSFLDPNRLPPGTPFFQYVQMTGFRQVVRQIE